MKIITLLFAMILVIMTTCSTSAQEKNQNDKPKTYTVGNPEVMPTFDMEELLANIQYPEEALKKGIQGQVLLKIKISKYGEVVDTKVIKSDSKLLNEAAEDAVKATKFTPARNGDEPAESWVTLPVKFKLK